MQSIFIFLGRLCMSLLFLFAAFWHVTNWDASLAKIAATEVAHADLILIAATLLLGIGGISLLFGYKTRTGATLLIIEILMTAVLFHPFWNASETELHLALLAFLSRLALCGGLFVLVASGPGVISMDHRDTPKVT